MFVLLCAAYVLAKRLPEPPMPRRSNPRSGGSSTQGTRRVQELIAAQLAGPTFAPRGLAEVAEAAGVSVHHFVRAFHTSLGETPYSYVLRRRLELARTSSGLILGAIKLSRATYRKMIQKLVWASAYSLVAIPVAGGLLVRWGLHLPMSVGAVAMSLSTIIVAANAQLLRQLKLQRLSL